MGNGKQLYVCSRQEVGGNMLQIGKQLTTEQRLSKAVVDIMGKQKYVALAGILMIGNRSIGDDKPTACTDGKNEK